MPMRGVNLAAPNVKLKAGPPALAEARPTLRQSAIGLEVRTCTLRRRCGPRGGRGFGSARSGRCGASGGGIAFDRCRRLCMRWGHRKDCGARHQLWIARVLCPLLAKAASVAQHVRGALNSRPAPALRCWSSGQKAFSGARDH